MTNIATTIEQSKHLLELGLNPETADIIFEEYESGDWYVREWINKPSIAFRRKIPCWSLSALLKLIPIVNENTYTTTGTLDGGAMISHEEITRMSFIENSHLEAVYNTIVYLLKNNYIKTERKNKK